MSEKLSAKVKTKELLEAIKIMECFISRKKSEKEYLKAIYIEADKKNNILILRSTDLKMSAKVKITGEINNDWKATVSCKIIKDLIKGISEGNIEFVIEKDKMIIQTSDSKSIISLMEDFGFPAQECLGSTKRYMVNRLKLKTLLDNVAFSASSDPENEAVNCVRLETDDGKLRAIGTDTYRLSYGETVLIQKEKSPKENLDVSVPSKAITGIMKAIKSHLGAPIEPVLIICERNRISFKFDYAGIEIASDLINLEFPDYKTIMRSLKTDKKVTLNTKDFLAVLKRTHSIAKSNKEAKNGAIFDFSQNKLAIKSIDEYSEFKEEIATLYTGEDLKISLNVKFLIDFIGKVKDKTTVVLKMLNNKSAVLVKSETDDSWIYLIMPLALREY
jgi:DNA polymerase-3 subunit beta